MKQRFLLVLFSGWAGVLAAGDATLAIYCNDSPNSYYPGNPAPRIDASAFCNRSVFSVIGTTLPYETQSTLYFTNSGGAEMFGSSGFDFNFLTNQITQIVFTNQSQVYTNYYTNMVRLRASDFVNEGSISATTFLFVQATNIINRYALWAGPNALVRIEGGNLDLGFGSVRTGVTNNTGYGFGGETFDRTLYLNASGVSDIYWGTGADNAMSTARQRIMPLTSSQPSFTVPFPLSPVHDIQESGFVGTFGWSIPSFFNFSSYDAFVFSNTVSATSDLIQIVFVPTNSISPNFTTQVRFASDFSSPNPGAERVAIVEFALSDFDVVRDVDTTNYVYLIDSAATLTNIFLQQNFTGFTRRPSNYAVERSAPLFGLYNFNWQTAQPTNAIFTNTLIYGPGYATNAVHVNYAAYSAQIGTNVANPYVFGGGTGTADPATLNGRIEIDADTLDLNQTRIRAETTLILKTRNLVNDQVGIVDAPYIIYDIGTTNNVLVLSNLVRNSASRLSGSVAAWTGLWTNSVSIVDTNTMTTNVIERRFHVLIVDHQFQTTQPVLLDQLAIHATNAVLLDSYFIGRSLLFDVESLTIGGTNGAIYLPPSMNWAPTNFPRLLFLTNYGSINIPGSGNFYGPSNRPLCNLVNTGFVYGSTLDFRTKYFENSGYISAVGGTLSAQMDVGNFNYGQVAARGVMQLTANDLNVAYSTFQAGLGSRGALILTVSNHMNDFGPGGGNEWTVTDGFQLPVKPRTGDLFGTTLRTVAGSFQQVRHRWAGEDRGLNPAGFTNNAAVGRLVLDCTANTSLMIFSGYGARNAIYADYLELQNFTTNHNSRVSIDTNFVIYFANANVPPDKLNHTHGERLRWVHSYGEGPASSTNITYPSGITYKFNLPLVLNSDLDSDGDGIVNRFDPTPLFVSESVDFRVGLTNQPAPAVVLSWNTLADSANFVEFKTNFTQTTWSILTNFVNGPLNRRVTVTDPAADLRFYRVRVEPPSP